MNRCSSGITKCRWPSKRWAS